MQEVAVGGVDLDAVEPGADRVARTSDHRGLGGLDLVERQSVRDGERLLAGRGADLAVDRDRAGADDAARPVDVRVAHAAGVHELQEDQTAVGVDRVGDRAPRGDLLVGLDARLAGERLRLLQRVRALGDDQADARALPVVLDGQLAVDATLVGARAGERGHRDAVRELEVPDGDRGEEVGGCIGAGVKSHADANTADGRAHSGAGPGRAPLWQESRSRDIHREAPAVTGNVPARILRARV